MPMYSEPVASFGMTTCTSVRETRVIVADLLPNHAFRSPVSSQPVAVMFTAEPAGPLFCASASVHLAGSAGGGVGGGVTVNLVADFTFCPPSVTMKKSVFAPSGMVTEIDVAVHDTIGTLAEPIATVEPRVNPVP